MIRKLNNKGYMLVEIILAFVIALGVTYFMFELIIKIKNKNDDLLVKSLVSTDQAIIYNTIMKNLDSDFECNKIVVDDNKFKYDGNIIIEVSEYAEVSNVVCSKNGDKVSVRIPIDVKQLKDNFDININYVLTDDESEPNEPTPPPPSSSSSSSGTGDTECRAPFIKRFEIGDSIYCCERQVTDPKDPINGYGPMDNPGRCYVIRL